MKFLSERRYQRLVADLTSLGMPADLARTCASYPDDLHRLDRQLSIIVERMSDYCRLSRQGTDAQVRHENAEFYRASVAIFSCYCAEIRSRRIPVMSFPRTNRLVEAGRRQVEQTSMQAASLH
jgi:hypothetical protein